MDQAVRGGKLAEVHCLSFPRFYVREIIVLLWHGFYVKNLSVCEALKLRSLPLTHPIYVASRYFQ